ncbi:serine protease [Savitreella phatthalungensis]
MSAQHGGVVVWTTSHQPIASLFHPSMALNHQNYEIINGLWLPYESPGLRFVRGIRVERNHRVFLDAKETRTASPWGLERMSRGTAGGPFQSSQSRYKYDYFPQLQGQGAWLYALDTTVKTWHSEFGPGDERVHAPRGMQFRPSVTGEGVLAPPASRHGTSVLSCAIGQQYGVAPKAKAFSVTITSGRLEGTSDSLLRGLASVRASIARMRLGASAVVLLAGHQGWERAEPSWALREAFGVLMRSNGAIVVTSAGNMDENSCFHSPGGMDEVITVGGTDGADNYITAYGKGPCVSVAGPAAKIRTAAIQWETSTRSTEGTSMSAAYAAGILLTALSRDSPLRPHLRTSEHALAWLTSVAWQDAIQNVPEDTPNLLLRTIQRDV